MTVTGDRYWVLRTVTENGVATTSWQQHELHSVCKLLKIEKISLDGRALRGRQNIKNVVNYLVVNRWWVTDDADTRRDSRREALEQTRARWNMLKPVRESWSKPKLEQASWVELVAFSIRASDAVAWT